MNKYEIKTLHRLHCINYWFLLKLLLKFSVSEWFSPGVFLFLFFIYTKGIVPSKIKIGSHFILSGFKYYVLTLTLIIWYNGLIVYIHVFTLYLHFKNVTLPVSHLNSSKSVLQYNRNTITHCTYFSV